MLTMGTIYRTSSAQKIAWCSLSCEYLNLKFPPVRLRPVGVVTAQGRNGDMVGKATSLAFKGDVAIASYCILKLDIEIY